jgi:hypothetical protein
VLFVISIRPPGGQKPPPNSPRRPDGNQIHSINKSYGYVSPFAVKLPIILSFKNRIVEHSRNPNKVDPLRREI